MINRLLEILDGGELDHNFSMKEFILVFVVRLLVYGLLALILSLIGFEWKHTLVYHNFSAFFPLIGVVVGTLAGAIIRLIQERKTS